MTMVEANMIDLMISMLNSQISYPRLLFEKIKIKNEVGHFLWPLPETRL